MPENIEAWRFWSLFTFWSIKKEEEEEEEEMLYLAHGQLKTIGQETLSKTSLDRYRGSHHGNYNSKLLTAFKNAR